jgi:UDP-N-acetylmuramoylalanine--D-glutamate ligase
MAILDGVKAAGIWGFGREGRAAFDHIRASYPQIEITVLNDTPLAENIDARTAYGPAVAQALGEQDVVVKSPGISLYRPEIEEAKRLGARFTSVTNLWFEKYPSAFKIAVTGTKGKSTTTRLLQHILAGAGKDAALIGNVGIPALGHEPGKDYTILELSSYQIADLQHAPQIAVVTNLYPEHVPWHRSLDRYYRDKLRLVELSPETACIANSANDTLREWLGADGAVTWFNREAGYRVRDGRLFRGTERIDCASFPLKGEHNLCNLAAAFTVAERLGVRPDATKLGSFEQLPHRLEEFRVGSGVLCINDSISTVPEAALAALKAYPGQDKILLLGGTDRGQDYGELLSQLPELRVKEVILLPRSGARILEQLTQSGATVPARLVANLEEGVASAMAHIQQDEMLLLSPASPSFGEFHDFEERGRAFMEHCKRYAP